MSNHVGRWRFRTKLSFSSCMMIRNSKRTKSKLVSGAVNLSLLNPTVINDMFMKLNRKLITDDSSTGPNINTQHPKLSVSSVTGD